MIIPALIGNFMIGAVFGYWMNYRWINAGILTIIFLYLGYVLIVAASDFFGTFYSGDWVGMISFIVGMFFGDLIVFHKLSENKK